MNPIVLNVFCRGGDTTEEQGHTEKKPTKEQKPQKIYTGIFKENKYILLVYWIQLNVPLMVLD